jgi:hypothetical protein
LRDGKYVEILKRDRIHVDEYSRELIRIHFLRNLKDINQISTTQVERKSTSDE